ncbi:hypothetical protein CHS0354_019728 [Potamilus streckersoni]|uniref:Protein kinase domain-containing protein n=1 Tax=Potamilus streckersoni TaxID=2493646 RepID=A0AAE0S9F2_9BIVA|nr:hypothetical protein CHS0354_019728 [Potamilus streckersoni]
MTSTDLIDTAKNGMYNETLALIQSGFPINACDKDNGTPLYWSSCRGFVQISQLLLKAGCDINACVTWGSTPLHAAADRGHEDCVFLLVESGAEVNRQNKRGDTPLHLASYRGHSNIVRTLIAWGADCSIKNNMSRMPAEEAESGGHPELARLINTRLQNMTRQNSLELRKQSTENVDTPKQNGYAENILSTNDLSRDKINGTKVKGEDFIRYNQSMSGFVRRPQPQENDSNGDVFIKHVQKYEQILEKSEVDNYDDVDGGLRINENQHHIPHLHVQKKDRGHSNFVCDRYEIENGCRTSVAVQESAYANGTLYTPSSLTQRSGPSHVTPTWFSGSERFNSVEDTYSSSSSGLSSLSGYTVNHSMASLPEPTTSTRGLVACMGDNISRQNDALINFVQTLQIKLLEANQRLEKSQQLNEELKSRLVSMQQDNNKYKAINATLFNENASLQASLQEQFKGKETMEQRCKQLSDEYQSLTKVRLKPFVSPNNFDTDDAWTHENFFTLLLGSGEVNLSESDSFDSRLKKLLESQWLQRKKSVLLDVPNREWVVGEDFILLEDKPLNHMREGRRDGYCSLVFRIRHLKVGQTLILKMMINRLNVQFQKHGDGYIDASFVPDFLIPLYQFQHPNIISILHHYNGSIGRFKKFVGFLIPRATDVPVDMANRATFFVMKEYPMTLKMFFVTLRAAHPEPNNGLSLTFLLHLLYQLLSVVCYLQSQDIIHRNIKSDNVFLDTQLRPVLGEFGLAQSLRDVDRNPLPFKAGQESCTNSSQAWTPENSRFNNTGPSVSHVMSLTDMYDREDIFAIARMFCSLLRLQADAEDNLTGSSVTFPHCSDKDIRMLPSTIPVGVRHILKQLVQENPAECITAKRALLSTGMILFAPPKATVTNPEDAHHYCQARMLKLLAIRKNSEISSPSSGHVLTMSESVRVVGPEIEADFISRISFVEFWEIYQYMNNLDLLHTESHNTS